MAKRRYSFHPIADEQQIQIWLYTYENWGALQADKYIDGLHIYLDRVAEDFSLLRDVPETVIKGVKFFHYGRHYVFIQEASANRQETLQVLSILHDHMDIPCRLRDILE